MCGAAGKYSMKVVPSPGTLSTWIAPPCACTMPSTTGSPSPVPLPTALVVKKGSKMRLRVAASMPQPSSDTMTRTAPTPRTAPLRTSSAGRLGSPGRTVSTRNSMRPGLPFKACTALVPRLSSTCPIWVGSAWMSGVPVAKLCTSCTCEGVAARSRLQDSARMSPTQTGLRCIGCCRLKASTWRTSSRPRRAAALISCRLSRAGAPGGRSWRASSALPRMAARMLLKSCATPPASVPSASIFCDWASCCSSACWCHCAWRSEVMSTKVNITCRRPPMASFSG
ncbi:hypothetical protein D9M68_702340 [compost metagenome]